MKTIFKFILIISFWMLNEIEAQNIGINGTGVSAHPSAILDVDVSPSNNKGALMPRLTTTQRIGIVAPANGLLVYDTNLRGIYIYDGTNWDCLNNPAGTIQYFANTVAPRGYLECNGQSISTTQYPELYTAIGYTYGGAGANFNVPDLRGEFVRGWDNGRNIDSVRNMGTWQKGTAIAWDSGDNALVNITVINPAAVNNCAVVGADNANAADFSGITQTAAASIVSSPFSTNTFQWGTGGTTRPRNVALMTCIKY